MKRIIYLFFFINFMNADIREVDRTNLDVSWMPEENGYPYVLSILIPTLTDRVHFFSHITSKLIKQIDQFNLQNRVEIVSFTDERNYSVGYKRNVLIRQSWGEYIVFVDDDDDISDNYVIDIYNALKKRPDSVSIKIIQTFQGKKPWYVFQGACFRVKSPFFKTFPAKDFQWHGDYQWKIKQKNTGFYRVECRNFSHWNPVRRSIAMSVTFPHRNIGEDCDWAQIIRKKYPLMTDETVATVCYHYCQDPDHSVVYDHLKNKERIK